MAKSKTSSARSGGAKIDFKKASTAQSLYWETLVGKKKISADQLPESFSFNLSHLQAYLKEVEHNLSYAY